jgi:NADPH-dependent 2,4-dienoyl-CoA reductase/sulfur reductase-like enzyme
MGKASAVAIIGAGPYALSTAAFLKRAGVEAMLFGELMGFWRKMPQGMFQRSFRKASNIADPEGVLTLENFERSTGCRVPSPIPLESFTAYGDWFRERAGINVDPRRVTLVEKAGAVFRLRLSDGGYVEADRLVVACGISSFAWRPPLFDGLDAAYVSHTSQHVRFDGFRGKSVLVVGGGQSALEDAALLNESGAAVEVVVRRGELRFLRGERFYESRVLYPSWGVGPPALNRVMGRPAVFRLLPSWIGQPLAQRAIRPAAAAWLRPRLESVRLTMGQNVERIRRCNGGVEVRLDGGDRRIVDHVLLGTGYRIDLTRLELLAPELLRRIKLFGGSPSLSPRFESSVEGLHFVGALAAANCGPGLRFVSHTGFAARAIEKSVRQKE